MKKTRFILLVALLLSVALLIAVPGCRQKKAEAKNTKDVKVKIPAFYFEGEDANDYLDESAEESTEASGESAGDEEGDEEDDEEDDEEGYEEYEEEYPDEDFGAEPNEY
jgi:hypothetical protein